MNIYSEFKNSALIGYTGFIGSNLKEQYSFSHLFNSKNSSDLRGQKFDLMVCAGVYGSKWLANKNPDHDWSQIELLLKILAETEASCFVLISTIDVYSDLVNVNEDTNGDANFNHPYGIHRLRVEEFIKNHFKKTHIIRLSGLFGKGLKKNIIYDLLNDNCLEMINPESIFQYYYLDNLWTDIVKIIQNNINLINISSEPIKSIDLISRFFPSKKTIGTKPFKKIIYDVQTKHSSLWGHAIPYLYSSGQIFNSLNEFINFKRPK